MLHLRTVTAAVLVTACARPGTPTPKADVIDPLFAAYSGDVPGAAVVVVQDGRVTFAKAYGLANLSPRTPATTASDFRLASLTKQFTATAVMQLVAQGKLRYDEPLTEVFPGFPPYGARITIRNLLNHTSGLVDYEDLIPDTQTAQVHDADVLASLERQDSTYFVPGSKYQYSNSGYVLLGLAVERASGQAFAEYLRDHIFKPLGMTATVAHREGVDTVPDRAYGYTVDSTGKVSGSDQSVTSATLGDGGVYTNVLDLVKWDSAIANHALVDSAAQRLAVTPPVLADGKSGPYGFGWFVDTYRGEERWFHHGETSGFHNFIARLPRRRVTVIVLTNRAGGNPPAIVEKILDLVAR